MHNKLIFVGSLVAGIALFSLLQTTSPTSIGPAGILLIFVLMYVVTLGLLIIIFTNYTKIKIKIMHWRSNRHQEHSTSYYRLYSLERSYYYASVLALAPVMLIGMASINSISIFDIILVIIFVLMGCLYVTRRTAVKR